MKNCKNMFYSAIVLAQIASPASGGDLDMCIGNLERAVIQTVSPFSFRGGYGNDTLTDYPEVVLNDQEKAVVSFANDNKVNSHQYFSLSILGREGTEMVTKEYYLDRDMDSLKKAGRKDVYSGFDSNCRCLPRGNKIDFMTEGQLLELNRQFMQRLKQVNSALAPLSSLGSKNLNRYPKKDK